jgi:hypothetical protein
MHFYDYFIFGENWGFDRESLFIIDARHAIVESLNLLIESIILYDYYPPKQTSLMTMELNT